MTEPLIPPPYLSPSSIDTFHQCPLKFKFSRIDKLVDPPTEATVLGSFVHAVLEELFVLPAQDRTLSAAKSIMASQWRAEWEEKTIDVLGNKPQLLKDFRWRAWWCIENYFKIEDPTAIDPKGIEHELNDQIESVPIKGFIDRWHQGQDGIIISDYKTGKTPNRNWVDGKFTQLLIYAEILCSQTEQPLQLVELLYLKDGVKFQKWNDDNLQTKLSEIRLMVADTHNQVQRRCEIGEFEATPNKLCNWCSYKSICPAWTRKDNHA